MIVRIVDENENVLWEHGIGKGIHQGTVRIGMPFLSQKEIVGAISLALEQAIVELAPKE